MHLIRVEAEPTRCSFELVQGNRVVDVASFLYQQRVIRRGSISLGDPRCIGGPTPPAQGLSHHLELDLIFGQVIDIIQKDVLFDILVLVLYGERRGDEKFLAKACDNIFSSDARDSFKAQDSPLNSTPTFVNDSIRRENKVHKEWIEKEGKLGNTFRRKRNLCKHRHRHRMGSRVRRGSRGRSAVFNVSARNNSLFAFQISIPPPAGILLGHNNYITFIEREFLGSLGHIIVQGLDCLEKKRKRKRKKKIRGNKKKRKYG